MSWIPAYPVVEESQGLVGRVVKRTLSEPASRCSTTWVFIVALYIGLWTEVKYSVVTGWILSKSRCFTPHWNLLLCNHLLRMSALRCIALTLSMRTTVLKLRYTEPMQSTVLSYCILYKNLPHIVLSLCIGTSQWWLFFLHIKHRCKRKCWEWSSAK